MPVQCASRGIERERIQSFREGERDSRDVRKIGRKGEEENRRKGGEEKSKGGEEKRKGGENDERGGNWERKNRETGDAEREENYGRELHECLCWLLVVIATILSSSLLCLKSTFSFHILRINHLDLETFGNLNS